MKYMTQMVLFVIVYLLAGSVGYAEEEAPQKKLSWKTNIKTSKEEPSWHLYYLDEVSYLEDGEVKWTVKLPTRMTVLPMSRMYKQRPDLDMNYSMQAVLITDEVVFVADRTGILILDIKSGKTLNDISIGDVPSGDKPGICVDKGAYEVMTCGQHFSGLTGSHGKFAIDCDKYLVYFTGRVLLLFDTKSYELKESTIFKKEHIITTEQEMPEILKKHMGRSRPFFMEMKTPLCEMKLAGIAYL